MAKRVAFISGAGRGIGFSAARDLGVEGFEVVIGVRSDADGDRALAALRADGVDAAYVRCDVTDPADHAAVAAHFEARSGSLDVLVNNAGVWLESVNATEGIGDTSSSVSADVLRRTFEVNFFGAVGLTQALLPLLRRAPAARIVNVSSMHASLTIHSDPDSPVYHSAMLAYGASKAALNMFTVQLAHELRNTPIAVNSADPGWIATQMGGPAATITPRDGGRTTAMLATLPVGGPSGGFFHLDRPVPW
ncbi:SDR family NAD(P)-dependent oxidoreductase [Mycobacteroides franklinii]|uniref:SDR family NAD(P)-dependent oxidoreductase n=1 Tax=Mycobacteroides franklinii TaxID=948102 RepID=UPI0013E8C103|nr:short-chain dehydrogenase [Mycobacteroides franklinii]